MDDCLFCKIANREIPSEILYEDEEIVAFPDINPTAPVHILIIPKLHIASSDDLNEENSYLVGKIFLVAKKLAKDMGLDEGYRLVNNCKEDGGQTVDHIHFHLLGGRKMLWPAG
nr:histidine triad nucleotide-binding protein [Tissierella sp.]